LTSSARLLRRTVESAAPRLQALPEDVTACPRAPGKWSPREVIGHLLDSAAHNHIRFVRAQLEEDLDFPGYDQAEWVRVQAYCESPWKELVELWRSYNFLLARIVDAIPSDVLSRPRARHSLHRIAWKPFVEGEPASLDDLITDYVDHLRHHVGQLVELPPAGL
jgi:DinB superfamily